MQQKESQMIHIISFFAFFTILSHIGVVFEWSFKTLANLSFVPLVCSIGLYYFLKVKNLKPVEQYAAVLNKNKLDYIYLGLAVAIILYLSIFSNLRVWSDEGFYSNTENHVLREPELQYLKYDDMLGEKDLGLLHVSYKVQSYQMLSAVFSYWFKFPNLIPRHSIFHIIAAILFILTWAKLFKLFLPDKWQFALLIFAFYIIAENTHMGVSNFSVTRFFDGKSVLFYVVIPLVFYYTIIFFRNARITELFYLFLIYIAGIGFSSSALFLLPIQIFVLSLCYFKFEYQIIKKIFLYGLSGSYLFLVALVMFILIKSNANDYLESDLSGIDLSHYFKAIFHEIWYNSSPSGSMLGNQFSFFVNLIAIIISFKFYPKNSELRKILIVMPLVMFFLILNPLLFNLLVSITTQHTYSRLVFILLIPLFFVILLVNMVKKQESLGKKNWNNFLIIAFISLGFFAIFLRNTHEYSFGMYNWHKLDLYNPRIDKQYHRVIDKVLDSHPEGTRVLASSPIPRVIATHPNKRNTKLVALVSYFTDDKKENLFSYQRKMSHSLNQSDIKIRDELYLIISGFIDNFNHKKFISNLKHMNVGSVVLNNEIDNSFKIVNILKEQNFTHIYTDYSYQIWILNKED